MNNEAEFGYKARQVLNQGTERLDGRVAARLHEIRQAALARQRQPLALLRLAATGHWLDFDLGRQARSLIAVLALTAGAAGTYYWNAFSQAQEFEEIDSALLADELPPSAYLDKGFHAWLERGSDSPLE